MKLQTYCTYALFSLNLICKSLTLSEKNLLIDLTIKTGINTMKVYLR
jgi:hypothetical protein